MKMDPGLKAAWLDNLSNGKYKKTKNWLCTLNGRKKAYCCLGVLLETAVEMKLITVAKKKVDIELINGEQIIGMSYKYKKDKGPVSMQLSNNICKTLGLSTANACVLAMKNDRQDNWDEIRHYIAEFV